MKRVGKFKKFGLSIIGILIILILAFLILMSKSNADDNAIVYFECKNLKKALNEKLGRSPDSDITIKDMHGLNGRLVLESQGITSMKGLEHLNNVTELNLWNNKIRKIEGLDNLTNLTRLYLSGNKISKIEGLDKLTKLTELHLFGNQISKIEGLDKLTKLTVLYLGKNKISKIEGLDNLTKLTYLNLEINQISKIEDLDKLTKLTSLNLGFNQIKKIEGLENLTMLTYLRLIHNQIRKIEGLDNLTNLIYLHLGGNKISKMEGLDNLTHLTELNLKAQKIYLDINSNEFELPKVMYKNKKREVIIVVVYEFKDNITKIGENRYRIDDEGIKKLKEYKEIFTWYEYDEFYNYGSIKFNGSFYAISKPKEKDTFNEEIVKNKCVKVGEKLDLTTLLLNKPDNARVEVVSDINTNSLGKKEGKIKVIFSDGSFKEIEVEVIVNTFDVQINYLDKKDKIVKSEVKEVKIDPEKLKEKDYKSEGQGGQDGGDLDELGND